MKVCFCGGAGGADNKELLPDWRTILCTVHTIWATMVQFFDHMILVLTLYQAAIICSKVTLFTTGRGGGLPLLSVSHQIWREEPVNDTRPSQHGAHARHQEDAVLPPLEPARRQHAWALSTRRWRRHFWNRGRGRLSRGLERLLLVRVGKKETVSGEMFSGFREILRFDGGQRTSGYLPDRLPHSRTLPYLDY